jgi:hypothetical protein
LGEVNRFQSEVKAQQIGPDKGHSEENEIGSHNEVKSAVVKLGEHYSVISSQTLETLDDLGLSVVMGDRLADELTNNPVLLNSQYFLTSLRPASSC